MASDAGEALALIEMHETIMRLADEVTRLTAKVASLTAKDSGKCHCYVGGTGPTMRARFFEATIDSDKERLDGCDTEIVNLEVALSIMPVTLEAHNMQMGKHTEDMKSLQAEVGTSFQRASTSLKRKMGRLDGDEPEWGSAA